MPVDYVKLSIPHNRRGPTISIETNTNSWRLFGEIIDQDLTVVIQVVYLCFQVVYLLFIISIIKIDRNT